MGLPITMIPMVLIIISVIGILWAIINARAVTSIDLMSGPQQGTNGNVNAYWYLEENNTGGNNDGKDQAAKIRNMVSIGQKIANGADAFLRQEYAVMFIFILVFGSLVFFVVDFLGNESGGVTFYATTAYVIGSITSMFCGWIGMKIAVASNYRTTYQAM